MRERCVCVREGEQRTTKRGKPRWPPRNTTTKPRWSTDFLTTRNFLVAISSLRVSLVGSLLLAERISLSIRLDSIGLDSIGLDWIGLDWIGLDSIGFDWIRLDSRHRMAEPPRSSSSTTDEGHASGSVWREFDALGSLRASAYVGTAGMAAIFAYSTLHYPNRILAYTLSGGALSSMVGFCFFCMFA